MFNKLNKLLSGEEHCGPFNTIKAEGANEQDEACRRHDIEYGNYGSWKAYLQWSESDEQLLKKSKGRPYYGMLLKKYSTDFGMKRRRVADNESKYAMIEYPGFRAFRGPRSSLNSAFPAPQTLRLPSRFRRFANKRRPGRRSRFRKYSSRKPRRFRRKGPARISKRLRYTIQNIARSIANQPHIVKSVVAANFRGNVNTAMFLGPGRESFGLAPGNAVRAQILCNALTGSATVTSFDEEFRFFWDLSQTEYVIHNPNNFAVKCIYYHTKARRSFADSVLAVANAAFDNTSIYEVIANVGVTPTSDFTQEDNSASTGPFDKLVTNLCFFPSDFDIANASHKIKKRSSIIIPAGGYSRYKMRRRLGLKYGREYQSIVDTANLPMIWCPMWRFEAMHQNTSDEGTQAQILEAGTPLFDITFKCLLTDTGSAVNAVGNARFLQNATVLQGLVAPTGTNFSVASTVGAANVAADNE